MLGPVGALCLEILHVTGESAPYLLVGFALAGLLHELLPTAWISRHLGGERPRSVIAAALLGAPLPLCSCGVVPAAEALRRKGAGRAPTLAFLVATPETGIESLALTYGWMGPVMTVVRPLAAVATAIVAGLVGLILAAFEDSSRSDGSAERTTPPSVQDDRCSGHHDEAHGHAHHDPAPTTAHEGGDRFVRALRFGFVDLFDELAGWLCVGLVLTGALSLALPDDALSHIAAGPGGVVPILLAALLSVPLYLCASSATPIAATLIAKGLTPGAALVFLLVGPATNGATVTLVARLLGRRWVAIHLGSITIVAIAAGLLLDGFAAESIRAAVTIPFAADPEDSAHTVEIVSSLGLAVAFGLHLRRRCLRFARIRSRMT